MKEPELSAEEVKQIYVMGARAQKKFNQLDTDRNGLLEGDEVVLLAEWVWSSFHNDEKPSDETRKREAAKILKRCDKNDDGVLSGEEFEAYYTKTAEAMTRFHYGLAKKQQSERGGRALPVSPAVAASHSVTSPSKAALTACSLPTVSATPAAWLTAQSFCGARAMRAPLAPPRLSVLRNVEAEAHAVATSSLTEAPESRMAVLRAAT